VVGLDLVEVAPSLESNAVTAATAAHLLLQVFAALGRGGSQRPDAG
jgi:arginase family enzyme